MTTQLPIAAQDQGLFSVEGYAPDERAWITLEYFNDREAATEKASRMARLFTVTTRVRYNVVGQVEVAFNTGLMASDAPHAFDPYR